ncbi:hypothetical protein HPB47_000498 [Ixodes persulcatus]|uniref:Uncharacterized protein n=1 Tax=Ixodes persulcatus TaxID=34615 RepID=A0AC60PS89_IXOPE|nr:hypothetical protein HPB47_000498 [Ixodes persulcatus]
MKLRSTVAILNTFLENLKVASELPRDFPQDSSWFLGVMAADTSLIKFVAFVLKTAELLHNSQGKSFPGPRRRFRNQLDPMDVFNDREFLVGFPFTKATMTLNYGNEKRRPFVNVERRMLNYDNVKQRRFENVEQQNLRFRTVKFNVNVRSERQNPTFENGKPRWFVNVEQQNLRKRGARSRKTVFVSVNWSEIRPLVRS